MIGPIQKLLSLNIDEMREKNAVEGRVLTDKNCLFPLDAMFFETSDDLFRDNWRRRALSHLFPRKSVDFQAFPVALLPNFCSLRNNSLVFFQYASSGKVCNFERNLEKPMGLRIESIRF
jgi:hypothetical protein